MKRLWLSCLFVLGSILSSNLLAASPNFIKVKWEKDKAWFTSPNGEKFISMGVDNVNELTLNTWDVPTEGPYYNPIPTRYKGDKNVWVAKVLERMKAWKFNSFGAWANEKEFFDKKIPYTVVLWISRGEGMDRLDDVFSDGFLRSVKANAEQCKAFKDDPYLMGYFLDNELPWYGANGWDTNQESLFARHCSRQGSNATKAALIKFMKKRFKNDIKVANTLLATDFKSFADMDAPFKTVAGTKAQKELIADWAGHIAERYYSESAKAIRAVDPNHLLLGDRFAAEPYAPVAKACARYNDVVSLNYYEKSGVFNKTRTDNLYLLTKKPLLIGEFAYSSKDNQSNLPSNHGVDCNVPTQADRAVFTKKYLEVGLALPYMVGFHWFQYYDEPPAGRKSDGENINFGLVDIYDNEYTALTKAFTEMNGGANQRHQDSTFTLPKKLIDINQVVTQPHFGHDVVQARRAYLGADTKDFVFGGDDTGSKFDCRIEKDGTLNCDFVAVGWGSVVLMPPGAEPLVAKGIINVSGYKSLHLNVKAPKGSTYNIFLNEYGRGETAKPPFAKANGADAEAFAFGLQAGKGTWETLDLKISDLERRRTHGNQSGNNILDLQGIGSIEIYFPNKQDAGNIQIKNFEFRP